ncbi:DUF3108 domain-containing protein [Pseudoalteromonas rubra]|uniref:DUF3108 domain-containing protein n=1 Tax=Pseudoalteromonas rubra TaxID=43658 RepID=A0A5S3WHN5_9GAMM|nr:DUF3108 domain-containing protein [Pseudoalteromonas rubra]TMP25926.1 DUF3108 domain-containing protein [Pseudoalteromonas rubra]TMP29817.1 DUF3108 domain-containing protein [Pseudoalteromonas rubra]
MPFLTINPFQLKAQPTQKNKKYSALLIGLSAVFSSSLFASELVPYRAEYDVLRKGEILGNAIRELSKISNDTYSLNYESDIEWMIFTDQRTESSLFTYHDKIPKSLLYTLNTKGTLPDKSYKIRFDRENKQLFKSDEKYPINADWNEKRQDVLSYQIALRNDVKAGKTKMSYPIVDKNGNVRSYDFEVIGTEAITLPIGNVETIKVKRLYDNNKRQAVAWLAPAYHYSVVQMFKGKDGVEQFMIQLKSFDAEQLAE